MEQMPLIYSACKAVLILDNELEANEPVYGQLVVSVDRDPGLKLVEDDVEIGHEDLSASLLGARRYQLHLRTNRALRLIQVWNALLGKTSTKRGELHAILANLLDVSATKVLALPPCDRMKAILGNYSHVPLDMLLSGSPEAGVTTTVNDQMLQLNDEDRWIPHFPVGMPIKTYRSNPGIASHASLENLGLLLPSTIPRLRLFKECSKAPRQGPFTFAGCDLWVEFMQVNEYAPPLANGSAFYLLHEHPEPANLASRGFQGNGARLIYRHLTQVDHGPQCSFIFDRPLIFGVLEASSQEIGRQEIIVEEVEDRPSIMFECGKNSLPRVP
ncbi:hypothetical protein LTR27_000430 [Elasticomyces elasticus]|nr:hypothetical protein LTR27_000430 [Elasticomyces elasticus]